MSDMKPEEIRSALRWIRTRVEEADRDLSDALDRIDFIVEEALRHFTPGSVE